VEEGAVIKCDICQKQLTQTSVRELEKRWRTDDVKEVCQGCIEVLNDAHWKIDDYLSKVALTIKERAAVMIIRRLKRSAR
jgi:hypothetical protein